MRNVRDVDRSVDELRWELRKVKNSVANTITRLKPSSSKYIRRNILGEGSEEPAPVPIPSPADPVVPDFTVDTADALTWTATFTLSEYPAYSDYVNCYIQWYTDGTGTVKDGDPMLLGYLEKGQLTGDWTYPKEATAGYCKGVVEAGNNDGLLSAKVESATLRTIPATSTLTVGTPSAPASVTFTVDDTQPYDYGVTFTIPAWPTNADRVTCTVVFYTTVGGTVEVYRSYCGDLLDGELTKTWRYPKVEDQAFCKGACASANTKSELSAETLSSTVRTISKLYNEIAPASSPTPTVTVDNTQDYEFFIDFEIASWPTNTAAVACLVQWYTDAGGTVADGDPMWLGNIDPDTLKATFGAFSKGAVGYFKGFTIAVNVVGEHAAQSTYTAVKTVTAIKTELAPSDPPTPTITLDDSDPYEYYIQVTLGSFPANASSVGCYIQWYTDSTGSTPDGSEMYVGAIEKGRLTEVFGPFTKGDAGFFKVKVIAENPFGGVSSVITSSSVLTVSPSQFVSTKSGATYSKFLNSGYEERDAETSFAKFWTKSETGGATVDHTASAARWGNYGIRMNRPTSGNVNLGYFEQVKAYETQQIYFRIEYRPSTGSAVARTFIYYLNDAGGTVSTDSASLSGTGGVWNLFTDILTVPATASRIEFYIILASADAPAASYVDIDSVQVFDVPLLDASSGMEYTSAGKQKVKLNVSTSALTINGSNELVANTGPGMQVSANAIVPKLGPGLQVNGSNEQVPKLYSGELKINTGDSSIMVEKIVVDKLSAGTADFLGTATFQRNGTTNKLIIDNTGLTIQSSTDIYTTLTSTGITIRYDANNKVTVSSSGIVIGNDTTGQYAVLISSTGMKVKQSGNTYVDITTSKTTFGHDIDNTGYTFTGTNGTFKGTLELKPVSTVYVNITTSGVYVSNGANVAVSGGGSFLADSYTGLNSGTIQKGITAPATLNTSGWGGDTLTIANKINEIINNISSAGTATPRRGIVT